MPADDTFCATCEQPIRDEVSSDRRPCPTCGSLARRYAPTVSLSTTASLRADLEVKKYPNVLLATAKRLLESGEFGIATVVVHMACEAAAEVAFSEAYVRAGVAHLERPVGRFLNGFNLATDRIRGLYNALSGEAVEGLPFWPAFAASSDRRNAIMHKGARATHSEAEASLQAGEALVAHLGDVGGRQPAA